MDSELFLLSLIPSLTSIQFLGAFLLYLALAGTLLPGKVVPGAVLSDGTRLHYRCNGLISLLSLVGLLGIGVCMKLISPAVIANKGLDLLSVTLLISFLVCVVLCTSGLKSKDQGSSLKRHVSGNIIHDCGVSRHCNYRGELLLALSFSLPSGASSIIPYFYPLYLLILLIWRERRDEERYAQKYKEVWMEYCKLVPWRIFFFIKKDDEDA